MQLADRLITADDIIACRPCYEDDRVREMVPEPTLLSSILEMENVPAEDRVWTVVHLLSAKEAVYVAATIVRRTVWHLLTDNRSRRAVKVAEEWVKGEVSDGEVTAADTAKAAWAAIRAARAAQAADADWAADAARVAAGAAAWAANAAGAGADQIEIIQSLFKKG
jgi:hypothetical protein